MNRGNDALTCRTLLDLARTLRQPGGCPWDREQTLRSLTPYLLEETHEVMEAVEEDDSATLREELGDLLFLILSLVALAEEKKIFALADVIRGTRDKIIFRHPHVFEEPSAISSEKARAQWEKLKRRENQEHRVALRAGAGSLPALLYALRIQQKAASFGFDWDHVKPLFDKIREETVELEQAVAHGGDPRRTGEELGDMLFSVVNLSRHLNQDPERALRGTVERFCERFNRMSDLMRTDGLDLEHADLAVMDAYWEKAKTAEARPETGSP